MKWFDAGVNLLDKRFDPHQIIEQAQAAGVNRLCVITSHPAEWDKAIALYQAFPSHVVFTLGIHPHHADEATDADLKRLSTLLDEKGLVAIGECGLDYNRNFSTPENQRTVFKAQLQLARNAGRPLYLHEREAFDDQQSLLTNVYSDESIAGVAHCFTSTEAEMNSYLARGLHIGITGWVCDDKRGAELRKAVKSLPLERLILETDAPYLFPKHMRPRQRNNSPALLPHIGEYVAHLYQVSPAEIAQISYTNASNLFGIKG